MIKILITIAGSLISIIFTLISKKGLFPYTLRASGNMEQMITKTFHILTNETSESWRVLLFSFSAICSIVISIVIICYFVKSFNTYCSESILMKIIIPLWITVLIFNCLFALYYIMFLIIFLLALAILIFIVFTSDGGKSNGGPIHVRGHYRKGSMLEVITEGDQDTKHN